MSLKNYISKLSFSREMSCNLKTLVAFIVNSKRYSSKFKENNLDLNNNETFVYNFKQNKRKFELYLRTFKGDIDIFYEIFWKKTYDKHLSLLGQEPKVIIDLGAHIGMTSIYFALKYPNAKIISVEASLENFLILKQNTSSFNNIECINAAAYFEDGTVYFGNDELSYNQSISEKGRETKAVSVETLMKNYNFAKIDLLKIDIEGGEIELLSKNNSWLTNVDNIIIEIHRPYTRENLHNDLKPFDFKVKFEENFVLFANKLE